MADLKEVAECPLLALDPRLEPKAEEQVSRTVNIKFTR